MTTWQSGFRVWLCAHKYYSLCPLLFIFAFLVKQSLISYEARRDHNLQHTEPLLTSHTPTELQCSLVRGYLRHVTLTTHMWVKMRWTDNCYVLYSRTTSNNKLINNNNNNRVVNMLLIASREQQLINNTKQTTTLCTYMYTCTFLYFVVSNHQNFYQAICSS